MADLIGDKAMNLIISHEPGVVKEVARVAEKIGKVAEARLAAHRTEKPEDAQHHEIVVEHHEVDSIVAMEGPAPLSLEYGHNLILFGKNMHRFIPGAYIVTGAAGLLD